AGSHFHIEENRDGGKNRKQADVVSINRNCKRQMKNRIERRKVIGPKKTFLPQFNRRGEKLERRIHKRQLDQRRNTTRHRVYAGLVVQFHGFLLTFHRVFFELFVKFGHFRPQHFHLCLRKERLIGDWRHQELNQ